MGQAPDMRVRMSAEGLAEVLAGLKKVQQEAKNTSKAAKDVNVLNQALGDLGGILPSLGVGAAVAGLASLTKQALDTADGVGKLASKTGLSASTISILKVAADTADASFEELSKGLIKFNKTMGGLEQGSTEAGAAVRRLFGSAQALNGLNTEQRFFKVTQALAGMEAGFKKTKAAQDFFGKSGADLIPLINDLGGKGFDEASAKAKRLGLIIDDDLASAAQRANDSLKTLKQAAEGAATQFAAGLAPAIAESADALTAATTGEGVNGLRKVGEMVGSVGKGLTAAFVTAGKTIGFVLASLEIEFDSWIDQLGSAKDAVLELGAAGNKVLHGDLSGGLRATGAALQNGNKRSENIRADASAKQKAIREQFGDDLFKSLNSLFNPDPVIPGGKGGKDGGAGEQDTAVIRARLAALQAGLEQALALSQKYLDLDEQNSKQAFEDGKKSLKDYYEERRVILLTGLDNELVTLREKRKLIAQTPVESAAEGVKKKQELDAIDAQIAQKQVERTTKLGALRFEEAKKVEELAKRRLEIESQIAEVQGKTYEAALISIQRNAAEMKKAGVDPATVDRLTAALTAQAQFRAAQNSANQAASSVGLVKSGLDNRVASGELFPAQAAKEYEAAIAAALPQLRAYAEALKAAAITPEDQLAAAQYSQQIEAIGISADTSAQQMANFKASTEQALTSDLTNFFSKGIEESNNFGDAIRNLALSVADSLKQIAAQMLATAVTSEILGLFGKGGGPDPSKAAAAGAAQAAPLVTASYTMAGAGAAVAAGGAAVLTGAIALQAAADTLIVANSMKAASAGFAEGGLVTGPGTGTSDSINARLSDYEFVVRSAVVKQPGMLAHLSALNSGMRTPALRRGGSIPRFANGGLVTAQSAMAAGSIDGSVTVGLEDGLVAREVRRELKGPNAGRLIVDQIGQNSKRANRALGGRG